MRAYVFTDESLKRHAGRFVWLSLDGEKAKNMPLRRKLALVGYPSFFVIDPADERVAFRWVGGFSARQFPHLLDAGEMAVRGGSSPLDRLMVRADSLFATGQDSLAAEAYRQLIENAPPDHAHRGRAIESLVFALSQSGRHEAAADRAVLELPALGRSPSAASVAATGLGAALELPRDHPKRAALVWKLERVTGDLLTDSTVAISGDDRSGLFISLIGARTDAGDTTAAEATTQMWSAFLDGEAGRAKTPEQRAVYDSHRLSAYLELKQPERAIGMLQQSERDFPGDYNPPARLAVAYRDLRRWDEALAASDRALAKAYGPRQINLYRTRVDILLGRGDKEGARGALQKAIAAAEALPEGQRSRATIDSLKKRLDSIR